MFLIFTISIGQNKFQKGETYVKVNIQQKIPLPQLPVWLK